MTEFETIEEGGFTYLEKGTNTEDPPLLLLHGLFGTASNFDGVIKEFSKKIKVVLPILPFFEMPIKQLTVKGLMEYFTEFVEFKKYDRIHLLGNSLGGHIALLYILQNSPKVQSLTLTGSSGLFENAFGSGFPRREDYEYIKHKVKLTFYDPTIATKAMVDEVFSVVNERMKAIRIIRIAKSAIRHNVGEQLQGVEQPTLLVWGKQDTITPPFVAEKFHELLPNSELMFLDKCGHAPMLELPDQFNEVQNKFLSQFMMGLDDPS